jgi:hypothetical protein
LYRYRAGDDLPQTNCVRCVEGYGDRLITLDPITGGAVQVMNPVDTWLESTGFFNP